MFAIRSFLRTAVISGLLLSLLLAAPATAGRLHRSLPLGQVTGVNIPVRSRPHTYAEVLLVTEHGSRLTCLSVAGKWAQVSLPDGRSGWIFREYFDVEDPGQTAARGTAIVAAARSRIGRPYVWGGNGGRGYDCSGLVRNVFGLFDLQLPRTAAEQYRVGDAVSRDQLKPGDRLFFSTYRRGPSHVGIYIGDNQFIHASSSRRRVVIDSLSAAYYTRRYIGARR